jgi:glycyl-tRNA synthetase
LITWWSTPRDKQDAPWIAVLTGDDEDDNFKKRLKKVASKFSAGDYTPTTLDKVAIADYGRIIGPDASKPGTLTEPRAFSLLMETSLGAVADEDSKAYLRGETAQGIFINFTNVVDSCRGRIPFGIAQVGKAFRNEVNPRNFIFRVREFEQMEMEFFCHPDEAPAWFDFWVEQRKAWWQDIGITNENRVLHEYNPDELIFYSKRLVDVEYKFPFTDPNFGELESIAYRTNYDLTQHQKHSGQKMEYFDPVTNERYIPHVIEPAAGLTRACLAVLCEAYTIDPNRPSGVYLNFKPSVAPVKAAILPLTAKDQHPVMATKLYMDLREDYAIDLDIKQNIGKRYARQDEIGTPYCFTIDDQTVSDQTVTVRHRNSMAQERIGLDHVRSFLAKGLRE